VGKQLMIAIAVCCAAGLDGCGVLARLGAWDAHQYALAGASVERAAIREHLETQDLLEPSAPPATLAPVPDATNREARRMTRLLVRADAMEELQLENESRTEELKQEMLEAQMRDAMPISVQRENDRLLMEWLR
jgi:hypothetical protein